MKLLSVNTYVLLLLCLIISEVYLAIDDRAWHHCRLHKAFLCNYLYSSGLQGVTEHDVMGV